MRVSRKFFSHWSSGKVVPMVMDLSFYPALSFVVIWTHLRRHSRTPLTLLTVFRATTLVLLVSGRHSPLYLTRTRADFKHSSKTLSFFSFWQSLLKSQVISSSRLSGPLQPSFSPSPSFLHVSILLRFKGEFAGVEIIFAPVASLCAVESH